MKLTDLMSMVGGLPYFDLATLAQLSGEKRDTLRIQLSRWIRQKKILSLRRGMYAPALPFRRVEPNAAMLANDLYRPSYLSLQWALGYHGLIPEAVFVYTSVTTRVPRRFENAYGHFHYRNIKTSAFFGYDSVDLGQGKALVATPEKALLDLWHVEKGEWSLPRMQEMRFQNFETVSQPRLTAYVRRFGSPRLDRAAGIWKQMADEEAGRGNEP